jgi:hypothetical protein
VGDGLVFFAERGKKMECFAMKSKRTVLAAATAMLLTAATAATASAQGQERANAKMNAGASGSNLSTGARMNARGSAGTSSINAGQQFQGGRSNQRQGVNFSRNEFQGQNRNRSALTSNRYSGNVNVNGSYRDRGQFAYRRDGDRFASYGGYRDRFAYGGWGGSTYDVSVGYGGWGQPGYYDYGYDSGYSPLYSYAPGYVSVGFGGGCTCGSPGWAWR